MEVKVADPKLLSSVLDTLMPPASCREDSCNFHIRFTPSGWRFLRVSMAKDIMTTLWVPKASFLDFTYESRVQELIMISGKAMIKCLDMFSVPNQAVSISYNPLKDDHLLITAADKKVHAVSKLKVFESEPDGLDLATEFQADESPDFFILPQLSLREVMSEFVSMDDILQQDSHNLFQIQVSPANISKHVVTFQLVGNTTALRTELTICNTEDESSRMKVTKSHNLGFSTRLVHYFVRILIPAVGVRLRINEKGLVGIQVIIKSNLMNTPSMQVDMIALPVKVGGFEDDIINAGS